MIRKIAAAALIAAAMTLPAAAAECGAGGKGAVSIHYDTGKTGLTDEHKARLIEFADVAQHSDAVCIFAQVDAQGSEEANKRVADARAQNVRKFLVAQGVQADRIRIAKQEQAMTLFGLLGEESKNDRRVTVSYE